MPLIDPYATLAVPKDLVTDFFGVFARCEFVMKDTHLYERAEGGARRRRGGRWRTTPPAGCRCCPAPNLTMRSMH